MPVHMYLIIHCFYLQHFHALRLEHPRKCKVRLLYATVWSSNHSRCSLLFTYLTFLHITY
jgi:hypothetical protein